MVGLCRAKRKVEREGKNPDIDQIEYVINYLRNQPTGRMVDDPFSNIAKRNVAARLERELKRRKKAIQMVEEIVHVS